MTTFPVEVPYANCRVDECFQSKHVIEGVSKGEILVSSSSTSKMFSFVPDTTATQFETIGCHEISCVLTIFAFKGGCKMANTSVVSSPSNQ